ncbi:hypothetical protein ACLB2K_040345 [Fragaria x ananassa]
MLDYVVFKPNALSLTPATNLQSLFTGLACRLDLETTYNVVHPSLCSGAICVGRGSLSLSLFSPDQTSSVLRQAPIYPDSPTRRHLRTYLANHLAHLARLIMPNMLWPSKASMLLWPPKCSSIVLSRSRYRPDPSPPAPLHLQGWKPDPSALTRYSPPQFNVAGAGRMVVIGGWMVVIGDQC